MNGVERGVRFSRARTFCRCVNVLGAATSLHTPDIWKWFECGRRMCRTEFLFKGRTQRDAPHQLLLHRRAVNANTGNHNSGGGEEWCLLSDGRKGEGDERDSGFRKLSSVHYPSAAPSPLSFIYVSFRNGGELVKMLRWRRTAGVRVRTRREGRWRRQCHAEVFVVL